MKRETPLTSSVVDAAKLYARQSVAKLDSEQVLEALRAQGIGTLEDLVGEIIQAAGGGLDAGSKGQLEPWEMICFDWFIYKRPPVGGRVPELVQPEILERLHDLEGRIGSRGFVPPMSW